MSRKRKRKPEPARSPKIKRTDERTRPPGRSVGLLAALILVVGLCVFLAHRPTLSAKAFSFDDDLYLKQNPLVQNPSWHSAGRFLSEVLEPSTVGGYYQPLAMISLMLDHATGGNVNNLRPFHRTSLILHLCNTGLVIVLLFMLFGQPWIAALVGLLFGLHPMTVEPIPWVGERKTLLAAFFSLWSLVFYVRYARRGGWKSYVVCLAMYVLAVMSKPTSTPLPVGMLLLDAWPLRRLSWRAVIEKIPFFAIAGVSSIVTIISQGRTATLSMPTDYAPTRTPYILCHNIIFYLYKIVWPANLSSHYPFPEPLALRHPMVLTGVVGTCLLLASLVISLRWTRALFVGWLFFFVTILPAMGIVGFTNVIASDKFAYLPSVGLLLVVAWLLMRVWRPNESRRGVGVGRIGACVVVLVFAMAESIATYRQGQIWSDSETLHRHMVASAPHSATALNSYGLALAENGKKVEAIKQYQKALESDPRFVHSYHNLANALLDLNRVDESIPYYLEALRYDSTHFPAHNGLGTAFAQRGQVDEAIKHFKESLRIKPLYNVARCNLAIVYAQSGRADEAIATFKEALRINPRAKYAHHNLANVYLETGRFDEAIQHYRQELALNPSFAPAFARLGIALARKGDLPAAIQAYHSALAIKPAVAGWHRELADLLRQANRTDEAVAMYRKTLQLNPNDAKAKESLKALLAAHSTR